VYVEVRHSSAKEPEGGKLQTILGDEVLLVSREVGTSLRLLTSSPSSQHRGKREHIEYGRTSRQSEKKQSVLPLPCRALVNQEVTGGDELFHPIPEQEETHSEILKKK